MPEQVITAELRRWIVAQAEAGCQPDTVVASMVRSGWTESVALQARRPSGAGGGEPAAAARGGLRWLAEPRRMRRAGRAGAAAPARSETVDTAPAAAKSTSRAPATACSSRAARPAVVERIERRIAALLRWPVDHGEGLQVLRYRPGAEYRPHHDYFDPEHPGTAPCWRAAASVWARW
jgi:prolyl 4-hydroxylase